MRFPSLLSPALALVGPLLALATGPAAALDMTGKWLLNSGMFADVSQSGTALTFDIGSAHLTGTVDGAGNFSVSTGSLPTCVAGLEGVVVGDSHFVGSEGEGGNQCFSQGVLGGERCQCFDGNTVSGDGCDARCQVEPCFTCSGNPSTCVPSPDGSACDDRDPCTTGETCTAGVCGGGTPVVPCINLTGHWQEQISGFDITSEFDIAQMGNLVEFGGSPTMVPTRVGTLDQATGALSVASGTGVIVCQPPAPVDTATGTAASDGNSYMLQGTLTTFIAMCHQFNVTFDGTRCNGPCPTTTTSTSTSTTTTTLAPPCPPAPVNGCQPAAAQKASLALGSGKLSWKWTSSATVAATDFGNPAATNYVLCIYDASGEKLTAEAQAGAMCGTTPCWRPVGTSGFKYGNKDGVPDGLTKMTLKAGGPGNGKIETKGSGTNLHLPTLPLTIPVRVQLQQSSSSGCWEAVYSAATTNAGTAFKAKSD